MKLLSLSLKNKNFMVFTVWSTLVSAYFFSLQNDLYLNAWDIIVYTLQLGIDFAIGMLGYFIYKYRMDAVDRKFFLLIFISFLFGLATNEIYNVLVNIGHVKKEAFSTKYWSWTYASFLIVQFIAWAYLLKSYLVNATNIQKKWLTIYPYLQSASMILFSLIVVLAIQFFHAGNIGDIIVFNSTLEIVVLTLIAMCLSRSKNAYMIWISTGLMLVIGFNFAHRFSDSMSVYYKTFNIAWFITLIVLLYGLLLANKNRDTKIMFFEEDSVHVMTSGAFIIFSNFLLAIFILTAFGFAVFQMDKIASFSQLALDIPGALVISYSLTIIFAKYLSSRLSMPLEKIIQVENNERNESEKKSALLELAARVAHDIRSPIAVMEMSLNMASKDISADKMTMMKMAVQSIRDIANNLLAKYRGEDISIRSNNKDAVLHDDQNATRPILLQSVVEQSVSQKRHEWLHTANELELQSTDVAKLTWISVAPVDIKRMLSNLLNNAAESCNKIPKIKIELNKVKSELHLTVSDNGVGMEESKIDSFLTGASSKHEGAGLGLSGAKKYMESIGGALKIHSVVDIGTKITLIFPCISHPAWFTDTILMPKHALIVILDDDEAMRMLWFHRFQKYPVKIFLFTNYNEAVKWTKDHVSDVHKMIFIVDYDLLDLASTGAKLLQEFSITSNGYLVTSHAEEISVQQLATEQKIHLIPKSLSNLLSIE